MFLNKFLSYSFKNIGIILFFMLMIAILTDIDALDLLIDKITLIFEMFFKHS